VRVYQVNILLPKTFSKEFVSLIPRQRRMINELLQKGIMESYAISADRSKALCAVHADNEEEVNVLFSKFPMFHLMTLEITELSWYNKVQLAFPPIVYN
jgi:muconolactone delta-isomerase